MSGFSSVDDSADPAGLVRFLDAAATAESGMKQYAVAAHALRRPARPVLDLGCGAGHDLVLFATAGLSVVGLDPSAVMAEHARARTADVGTPILRGTGEALPCRDGALAGCRMERVLMHVDDPIVVLAEVLRCLQRGGLVTVFEPDWSAFRVKSEVLSDRVGWLSAAKHPDIGAKLWELMDELGCDVLDRVEELSVWRSLGTLKRVAGFPLAVERAVAAGRIRRADADRWIDEQLRREAAGEFFALMPKILVVATKR